MGIETILATVARTRAAAMGVPIRYRAGEVVIELRAAVGSSSFDSIAQDGNVLRYQSRDYLFPAEQLAHLGERFEPEEGHQIEERVGCEWRTYKVLPVDGQQCFRYADPFRQELRVHTQKG